MAKRIRVPDFRIPSRHLTNPAFAQPEPTPDPSTFKITHPSDDAAYKIIDELNAEHKIKPLPFPAPRGGQAEPQLNLTQGRPQCPKAESGQWGRAARAPAVSGQDGHRRRRREGSG
jgi:hypothetical protein